MRPNPEWSHPCVAIRAISGVASHQSSTCDAAQNPTPTPTPNPTPACSAQRSTRCSVAAAKATLKRSESGLGSLSCAQPSVLQVSRDGGPNPDSSLVRICRGPECLIVAQPLGPSSLACRCPPLSFRHPLPWVQAAPFVAVALNLMPRIAEYLQGRGWVLHKATHHLTPTLWVPHKAIHHTPILCVPTPALGPDSGAEPQPCPRP